MSERTENALNLAKQCWQKAYKKDPKFVGQYLFHAEKLLSSKPVVLGDEFCDYCKNNLLFLPKVLHHNTWVSGVKMLQTIGWIVPITKVVPEKMHNHMDSVTMWKSVLYDGRPLPQPPQMSFDL